MNKWKVVWGDIGLGLFIHDCCLISKRIKAWIKDEMLKWAVFYGVKLSNEVKVYYVFMGKGTKIHGKQEKDFEIIDIKMKQ